MTSGRAKSFSSDSSSGCLVRAERSQKEGSLPFLDQLAAHLRQLALRLEAALG